MVPAVCTCTVVAVLPDSFKAQRVGFSLCASVAGTAATLPGRES